MWYMFIVQLFKGNPNFVVLEMLEAITKAQVYLENNILRDYNNYTKQEFSIGFSFPEVHLGPWDKL